MTKNHMRNTKYPKHLFLIGMYVSNLAQIHTCAPYTIENMQFDAMLLVVECIGPTEVTSLSHASSKTNLELGEVAGAQTIEERYSNMIQEKLDEIDRWKNFVLKAVDNKYGISRPQKLNSLLLILEEAKFQIGRVLFLSKEVEIRNLRYCIHANRAGANVAIDPDSLLEERTRVERKIQDTLILLKQKVQNYLLETV